jgi:hypothetical protein
MKKFYLFTATAIALIAHNISADSFEYGAYRFETNADDVNDGIGVTLLGFSYQVNQQTESALFNTDFFENGTFNVGDNTYVLTQIADNAFAYAWQHKFTELTIPATVEKVGSNAFAGAFTEEGVSDNNYMSYKAVLNIKGGTIGAGAFQNIKFKRVVVDASEAPITLVYKDWQSSFANSKFAYLSLNGNIDMAQKQFQNCGMAYVNINCSHVPDYAFSNAGFNSGSSHWTFGENVEYIGIRAFENLQNGLGDLVLPCRNLAIDECAFYNAKVTSVECTSSFNGTIGSNAFENNANLDKVSIYSESIGDHAFKNCVNLKTVVFGPKLRFIGSEVFEECRKVQDIFVGIEMEENEPIIPVCAPGAFYGVGYDVDPETADPLQNDAKHQAWTDIGYGDWGNIVYDLVKIHVAPYTRTISGSFKSINDKRLAQYVIDVMRNTECSTDDAYDKSVNGKGFLHQGWDRDWDKAFYCYRDHTSSDADMKIYDKPCGDVQSNSPYQVGNFWYIVANSSMNDVINEEEMGPYGEQVMINIPIEEFIFNQNWQKYISKCNAGMSEDLGMHIVVLFKAVKNDIPDDNFSGIFTTNREQMASQTMNVREEEESVCIQVNDMVYARDIKFQKCTLSKEGLYNSYTAVNDFIRKEYGSNIADMYKSHWSDIQRNGVYRDCRSETLCVPNDNSVARYYANAISDFHTDYEVLDNAHYEQHSVAAGEENYYISFFANKQLRDQMISYLTSQNSNDSGRLRAHSASDKLTMNNGFWLQMPDIESADDVHYVYKNIYIDEVGITTDATDTLFDADDNAQPVYYDMHGYKTLNPIKGNLYIQVKGSKTSKVFIK